MAVAPNPSEIFQRAVGEGERRLDQPLLELTATGFIAGSTIVFGIVALGLVRGILEPASRPLAEIGGALAFAIGFVFLFVGRAELFSENFFDPVAAVVQRKRTGDLAKLGRLWALTYVLNLVGGVVLALILSVEGVLRPEAGDVLSRMAEEIARQGAWAGFVSAVAGGALVTLMSYLTDAVNSVGSRMAVAYLGGFLLAIGPFAHTVVTLLHLFFGIFFGAHVGWGTLAVIGAVVTAGNLVGGLGLVTLTHIAQAKGARESRG
ncbi:MAG TPA: formate/nitrite transporter family protein [Longimicrobiaceae bacterium]|nr:formate/nitrite transporter family protein [Longimicrobiaceae bacterium]